MAAQRGTKNSLQTSSLVKASVGFEQSLLLKVRIGAGLFHLPFVLFIFFFPPFFFLREACLGSASASVIWQKAWSREL